MSPTRKIFTPLAAAFAFALVTVSCGGGSADGVAAVSDSEAPTTTAQTTTTAAPSSDDVMDAEHDDAAAHEDDEHSEEPTDHTNDGQEGGDHEDGDHGDEVEIPEGARVVFVTMDEWGYDPDEFSFKAGETVVFRINNAGIFEHEFRLSNAHRIEEHIASGHEGHGDEGDGHHADGDIFIEIEGGGIGELVVTFPEDMTVFTDIVCLLPDHYENGMIAELSYDG